MHDYWIIRRRSATTRPVLLNGRFLPMPPVSMAGDCRTLIAVLPVGPVHPRRDHSPRAEALEISTRFNYAWFVTFIQVRSCLA